MTTRRKPQPLLRYGEQLLIARRKLRLTQHDAAQRLTLTIGQYWLIETSFGYVPPPEIGERIAYHFGVPYPPTYLHYRQQLFLVGEIDAVLSLRNGGTYTDAEVVTALRDIRRQVERVQP